jgi:two-component system, OmpR family, alkaline phosphatase synthesis response regulator PhoP
MILIVEDESAISNLIKLNLNTAGYKTDQAFDGKKALDLVKKKDYDLVLLDIKLPKMDGYELLPRLIKRNIPVIFLTSKDSLKDKVHGLDLGADDYITKPFEASELIARIKAVLRRQGKDEIREGFDDIEIRYKERKVLKKKKEVELTAKEFELLKCLLENANVAVSREDLLEVVWGYDYPGNTRTVDIHVQKLRSKLGTERIKTVYKMGYRLEL